LIILAAIWGASFIFLRVLAPILGPVVTVFLRALIAGSGLVVYFSIIKFDIEWKRYWKKYLIIGAINTALPFFLFAFAALYIQASYSVILNSTAPFFGAIFSALWLGERLTFRRILGLIIGAVGVTLVVKINGGAANPMFGWAVAACTLGSLCYGLAATFIKKHGAGARPMGIAAGSQIFAATLLVPVLPFAPIRGEVTFMVALGILIFALLCNLIAYLLYYRLVTDVGPTRALTVTFLMPVFGMIWAMLFLNETITISMIAGTALIIFGTSLILNMKLPGLATTN